MTIQRRRSVLVWSAVLCLAVLGSVFVFGAHRPGGNDMTASRFTVNHAHLVTDKPFEPVTRAFERELGRFDPDVYKALAEGGSAEGAKAKIEAMAGPSGFMLFATHNHG